ncbi:unnamed protein product [Wuchereria bancrofti]|uniref:Uncharacterized protein n=1 Tax=Wuchereria bancrofti TaxID=6293 RepID=A0A3P7G1E9_WUCBA|nr:unnamed protein product [Wuchereria bancrofti]
MGPCGKLLDLVKTKIGLKQMESDQIRTNVEPKSGTGSKVNQGGTKTNEIAVKSKPGPEPD